MYRILVIEDEDSIRDLILMNLNMVGYETIEASNGLEGLRLIQDSSFDLCILDIMLPVIDGYELIPHFYKIQDTCYLINS